MCTVETCVPKQKLQNVVWYGSVYLMAWQYWYMYLLCTLYVSKYSFTEAIKRRILRYGVPQRGEAPLIYSNHILSYDRSKRTPVWVAERITQDQTQGKDSSRLSLLRSLFLFSLSLSPLRSVSASLLSLFFSPSRSVSASFLSLSLSLLIYLALTFLFDLFLSPPLSLSLILFLSLLSLLIICLWVSLSALLHLIYNW